MNLLIQNGLIVTMNRNRDVIKGDLLIQGNRISKIGRISRSLHRDLRVIDATDKFVIPGLIQTHVHLCQILFRGLADDLALLDWLKKKIWPMEAAHTAKSLRMSALLGVLEMQKSGVTSILDMGTVQHTSALINTVEETKIRYWGGKCLMDAKGRSGPLYESRDKALKETEVLLHEWLGRNSRINYALCPRFVISCTREMLEAVAHLQRQHEILVHTHASENLDEIELVRKLFGQDNIVALDQLGLLNSGTVVVHGVHMTERELQLLINRRAKLVHCPSSNLKLASGIAPIEKYRREGLVVGIGSDGAPCSNTMDPFIEMRLTALLQKPTFGPKALPAPVAFEMATLGGARVLGAERDLGSLEVGKLADLVVVDRSHPSVATVSDPYSALVYSCTGRDVTDVIIDGQVVVRDRASQTIDEEFTTRTSKEELQKLLRRLEH